MREQNVKRAILLLAGRGRRLGDLSARTPKCLIEVGGEPILHRSLRALTECGVDEIVLVVGYRHWMIREAVEKWFPNLNVKYVRNNKYASTNTAYSLWLARQYFDEALILVEGDIVFDAHTVKRMIRVAGTESAWAAIPVGPDRNEGILLESGLGNRVGRVKLVTDPTKRPDYLSRKCAGLQLLSSPLAASMAEGLDETYRLGPKRLFADLVLGSFLSEHVMRICPVEKDLWAEIDDEGDLEAARRAWDWDHAAARSA